MTTADGTTTDSTAAGFRALVDGRRAVRCFTGQQVPDAVIRDCLETAVLAPSSCNLQPWSFVVVTDPQRLERLHPVCLGQRAARAPLIIAVLARPDTWKSACQEILQRWPATEVPPAVERFYTTSAPRQYNQGQLGWRGLLKRGLTYVTGLRKAVMRTPNSQGQMRLWAVKSTALAAQNLMLAFQSHGYATCPMEGFDEKRLRKVLPLPRQAIPIMLLALGQPGERAIHAPRLRFPVEQCVTWY
jgi:nitroreductase